MNDDVLDPINTSINSTQWKPISLDGSTPIKAYMPQTRDGSDWKFKKKQDSEAYFTFRDGMSITIKFSRSRQPTVLFYAQSSSLEAVLETFLFNEI